MEKADGAFFLLPLFFSFLSLSVQGYQEEKGSLASMASTSIQLPSLLSLPFHVNSIHVSLPPLFSSRRRGRGRLGATFFLLPCDPRGKKKNERESGASRESPAQPGPLISTNRICSLSCLLQPNQMRGRKGVNKELNILACVGVCVKGGN